MFISYVLSGLVFGSGTQPWENLEIRERAFGTILKSFRGRENARRERSLGDCIPPP